MLGVVDPHYQAEIGLFLHNEKQEGIHLEWERSLKTSGSYYAMLLNSVGNCKTQSRQDDKSAKIFRNKGMPPSK